MTLSRILKKTVKFISWFIVTIIFLLAVAVFIIQIPSVQNQIIKKATSYLEQKTNGKFYIKRIIVRFPKTVQIDEILVTDLRSDTLLYAGETKININMLELLNKRIHIQSISFKNLTGNLYRSNTDSLYNYNFISQAFSTNTDKSTSKKKGSTVVNIEEVNLQNIRFTMDDQYDGLFLSTTLNELKLNFRETDIQNLQFLAQDISLNGFDGILKLKETDNSKKSNDTIVKLPFISASTLKINNSSFRYVAQNEQEILTALVGDLKISLPQIDLNRQTISVNKLILNESVTQLIIHPATDSLTKKTISSDPDRKIKPWLISARTIQLANNEFSYNVVGTEPVKNSFDINHLNYNNIFLNATNFYYSEDSMQVTIKDFKTKGKNNFEIKKLESDFLMTDKSIQANNLILKTGYSDINFTSRISFDSLSQFMHDPKKIGLSIQLKKARVFNPEVAYFVPALQKEPLFANDIRTTISGYLSGTVDNLTAQNLHVNTGTRSYLKTNINIRGLPKYDSALYNITQLELKTGRTDIELLVDRNLVPKHITLPEDITLNGEFYGKLNNFKVAVNLNSTIGNAMLNAEIDSVENFNGSLSTNKFDLGSLLTMKELLGTITLNSTFKGSGLDTNNFMANIIADVPEFTFNKYNYNFLKADIQIEKKNFKGKISLNDNFAAFELSGLANMTSQKEQVKINLNLKGADLKKLNFTQQDIRIALKAATDIKGSKINTLNGSAEITNIIISKNGKKYTLDSLLFAAINEKGRSELNVKSSVIGIRYKGTFAPADLVKELKNNLNKYFPLDTIAHDDKPSRGQHFDFEVELNNHPVLSEVFLPELKAFEPGKIRGSFDSDKYEIVLSAGIKRFNYGNIDINNLEFFASSDENSLTYKLSAEKVLTTNIRLNNFIVDGKVMDKTANTLISADDEKGNNKLLINTFLTQQKGNYKISIDPKQFYIMNQQWIVPEDNYVLFGKNGFMVNRLDLSRGESKLSMQSQNEQLNSDIKSEIRNFNLGEISKIIQKDTALIEGIMNGDILLKRINKTYGLISNLTVANLHFREIALGDLKLKAGNNGSDQFDIDLNLNGNGNAITAKGFFIPVKNNTSFNFNVEMKPLTMKLAEALSFGNIRNSEGIINGNLVLTGSPEQPAISGKLIFNEVRLTPAILNSSLYLKAETLIFNENGVHFDSFTMLDKNNQPAIINGSVQMKRLRDLNFSLNITTNNFTLLNTNADFNPNYYGRLIVDSRIRLKGTPQHPVINSSIKLKENSHFTFAVPESELTTDKGESVVLFIDSTKLSPILTRDKNIETQKIRLKNLDISSTIEIDKKATLKLLLDPESDDSLVVRGAAALTYAMDPSGKISLTGLYNIEDGSYTVSLENVVKKKFKIQPGSTITWNGDPLDAIININAIYSIRTSPIDLVADQLPQSERTAYRQRFPFLVFLKMKGPLLTPEINFDIQLPESEKGAMGGILNAKLEQLKENPSALNKQVFALLVLNRFIQENPLETETQGTSAAARTTVGKFLSAELNKLTSKVAPGVDITFDIQSYDQYTTGKAEGRTEVGVGVSKQLFNERLKVQVGGSLDIEGEKAKQNTATEIAGDVTVEYQLSKDGRYRLKGFRHHQYEGALEGQITETGAGLLYVRDFEKWLQLILSEKNKKYPANNGRIESSSK